jgi:hypothetical protein
MDAAENEQLDRLRRQLRAQSAVNRQLHAQLDGGTVRVDGSGRSANSGRGALTMPRTTEGGAWLEHLHLHGGSDPYLVEAPTEGAFVIEGTMCRQVKAGILFTALSRVLGAPRPIGDDELERWSPGPPVEVMSAGTGPAFVVVGGRRLPLRGLPLPYLVSGEAMLLFPEGEELRVTSARTAPMSASARARKLIKSEGPVRGVAKLTKRGVRRLFGR